MNIKGLNPSPAAALDPRKRVEGRENVRLQNSGDRDADGRRQSQEPELKRHLNEAEFEAALKALKEIQGIAANGLSVRVEIHEDRRVIYIEDQEGKVVRRLSEADLWLVTREKTRPTGQIFDKTG